MVETELNSDIGTASEDEDDEPLARLDFVQDENLDKDILQHGDKTILQYCCSAQSFAN